MEQSNDLSKSTSTNTSIQTDNNSAVERDVSIDVGEIMKKAGRTTEKRIESEHPPKDTSSGVEKPPAMFVGHSAEMEMHDQIKPEHGDTVTMDDGTVGIVVDFDKEKADAASAMKIAELDKLVDERIPLYEKMSGEAHNSAIDYSSMIRPVDNNSVDSTELTSRVKMVYDQFVPSIHGVAPVGSEEARAFQAAKDALRSGEIRLPTVAEYDAQIAELEKKKKEEQEAMEQQNTENSPQMQPQESPKEPVTVNIAAMKEQYEKSQQQMSTQQQQPPQEQEPVSSQHINPQHVTTFQVPEGKAERFVDSLTPAERDKVEASKVIKVQEERMVKVPVVTRKIASLDDYKRISQSKEISEAVEVPLLNSGYIATVNGCGSLEMAAILPNVDDMEWDDYSKLYSFCFRRLVSTSIGTLSFRDFQNETSPLDLPQLVYAILRASQPDVSAITLVCGNSNCRKDYDIDYSLQDLPDWDDVTEEIMRRIDDIVKVRHILEDARKLHDESPVMTERCIDVGDGKVVIIKMPNGPMAVERTNEELMQQIADATSPLTAMFLINIKSIFITVIDDKGKEEVYELVDLMAIAAELQTFSDTQLEILKEEISKLESYEEFTYSFKSIKSNEIVCPHCGLVNKKIPCRVQQLVFRRVSKAMN